MVEASRRNKVGYMTYHETMVYAFSEGPKFCHWFSKGSGYMVDIILALSHYGVNVVYLVFVAVNLKQFIDEHFNKVDVRIMIAIIGIFLIPLFLLRQLKYLVPANILASFLILGGLLAIFWYFFRGLPEISKRDVVVGFSKMDRIPFALGIVLFATSSVGVVSSSLDQHFCSTLFYSTIFYSFRCWPSNRKWQNLAIILAGLVY